MRNISTAALGVIYGGKAYKRGFEYDITVSLAIMMMSFDAILSALTHGHLRVQCSTHKKAHTNAVQTGNYNDIKSCYLIHIMAHEGDDIGEPAQFLVQYFEQVERLLVIISPCRSCHWEGFLAELENLIKYYFGHDVLN